MTTKQSGQSKLHLILILGLLAAIGPFSIDMYLPAFPNIAQTLHTSVSLVMLSLSSFFIGISAGQLIYGPLLERFGRKKPLYVGLTIYAIASFACATTSSVNGLIVYRLFQALGGCVGMVASRAMVRDLFDVKDNAKVFSTLMLVIAVSPIIAPTLGGYLTAYLGWRYIFGVLIIIISIILAGVYFLLPESKQPDTNFSLKPAAIFNSFSTIIKHPQFIVYTFTGSLTAAALYAYISGSPYVFMVLFKVSEKHYGWIFAIIAAGLIGASQFNSLLLKKYTSEQVMRWGIYIQSTIGIILVVLFVLNVQELYLTIALIFAFLCCQGCIFPNASALSMAPFGHNAGSASALMGFLQMSIGALMSALVSVFQNGTSLPMIGIMAFCSLLAALLYTFGSKHITNNATKAMVEEEELDMVSTL
ncbi:MAG: multidrug effflux MFS transporter [Flavobacterium sp.]|nr:multidrug effflux MFS transporter [Flavobacterium sp.]